MRAYRRCRKQVDAAPGELAIRREERFYCYAEDHETMVFGGRVSIEQGRLLVKALDAMVAQIDDDAGDAADAEAANSADRDETTGQGAANEPETAEAAGNVSAETIDPQANENVSAETSGDGSDAERPARKPTGRATALVHIAEHYLATGASGARPLTSSEAYQVFIHVNANDAHPDNRINGAHTAYTDDRRYLAPHVVRQLACDAARRTVLENDRGEVLNIGRRSRTVPRHIAHALRVRDGGCRFPGCGRRRWTDAHHIRHWADGGETSLDNLITLCRYHHRRVAAAEGWDGDLTQADVYRASAIRSNADVTNAFVTPNACGHLLALGPATLSTRTSLPVAKFTNAATASQLPRFAASMSTNG